MKTKESFYLLLFLMLTINLVQAQSLTTIYLTNNGLNGAGGNQFDVTNNSNQTITIESFDGHYEPQGAMDNFEVWFKVGTHEGFETNSAAWILLGTANDISIAGLNAPTHIPIGGLAINPGETYGFYITSTINAGVRYLNGTGTETFTDGNLLIDCTSGSGVSYPFQNNFQPRIWNGTIYYSSGIATAPANDECTGAIPIEIGETAFKSTIGANSEDNLYCGSCEQGTGGGVWYSWIGDGSDVHFSTCNASTNFDTHVRVFDGTCGALNCVDGNDDFPCNLNGMSSIVSFSSTLGTEYYILVSGKGSAEGFFELTLQSGIISGIISGTSGVNPGDSNLSTLFGANNSFAGNMFDVTAFSELTINGFNINLSNSGSQETIEVYYKLGSHVGFESNANAWILLGTTLVTSAGEDNPTLVPIGGLTLPPGQVYGIYVNLASYGNGAIIGYTNGGPTTFQNDDLQITTGVGKGNPAFSGGTFFPRQWNGTIFYSVGDPCLSDTEAPEIICQNASVQLEANGTAVLLENDVVACKNDNCESPSITISQSNFNCNHIGTNTVYLTATDGNNNTASCTSTIEVYDISDGDVLLFSQADVDAYVAPCDGIINGSLIIQGMDIIDISNLSDVIEVTQEVIVSQTSITDLTGFGALATIGTDLIISNNSALQNLSGLGLTSLGESLILTNDMTLADISALSNITTIPDDLIISSNPSLTSLAGLENIISIGNGLTIVFNTALTDCCAIHNLLATPGAIVGFPVLYFNATGCDNIAVVMTTCAPSAPLIGFENGEGQNIIESQNSSNPEYFTVFPNPATDRIDITFLNYQEEVHIALMDMQGRLVFKEGFFNSNAHEIRTGSFARGFYSMIVTYPNGETSVQKVILQ